MDDLPPPAPLNQMTLMINELQGLLSQQKEDRKIMEKSLISQYQEERSKQFSNSEGQEGHQTPTPPPSSQPEMTEFSSPEYMKKMTHFQKFAPPPFEGAKTPLEAKF